MKWQLLGGGSLGIAGALVTLALGPVQSALAAPAPPAPAAAPTAAAPAAAPTAAAPAAAPTAAAASAGTGCPEPALTQPFAGDSRWYALAPGESGDDFAGTGWALTGGAKIETETLADGRTGPVLDLPAGSTATSSPMCVDSSY